MSDAEETRKHPLQKLMDNPWLLLVIGVVLPFASYTIWGWYELATMTASKLP